MITGSELIKDLLKNISVEAGVYQFYDANNNILYVGKAKNLKKRVSSYFQKQHENGKTRLLVKKIERIETIVVESELDALLLENNLIKKYQPRYNILLKDDKSYPWICLKNERFPRVFSTRKLIKDGSEYYGPYASIKLVNTLLSFIRQLYPLRTCNLQLSEENIEKQKFNVCLEYHIGNCKGPCINEQKEENYNVGIHHIRQILKGDIKSVSSHLKTQMEILSNELAFEQAQKVKEKILLLETYQAKSAIVSSKINDVDVFSIASDQNYAFINFFKVASGAIIQSHSMEIKKKLVEVKLLGAKYFKKAQ